MRIRNQYAYVRAQRNRDQPMRRDNQRQLERLDRTVVQRYVYVVLSADGSLDSVAAGINTARVLMASNPGSRIVTMPVIYEENLID